MDVADIIIKKREKWCKFIPVLAYFTRIYFTAENKLKKERTGKIVDNNRHKKRKKKSKNNQKQLFKTDKVSDINLKSTDLSKKYCDQAICKDNKELKKPKLKNENVNVNFEEKTDIDLTKKKKSHNLISEKPLRSTEPRKPYVFKKRIISRSKNYDFICYNNRFSHLPENNNCIELRNKQDHKKNYQKNGQINNEKVSDQLDNSITAVTPSNDNDNANKCSNSIFYTTQNEESLCKRNMNFNDIKIIFINKGTKYTKNKNCQYTDNFIENHEMKMFNDYHDKHQWDFYSHNGQNTYSINKVENSKRNKYTKNIKPIIESLHKNEYEKSLVYIGPEYTDQEIAKNQKLNSDVMDNLNQLSNSTFINTINQQNLQISTSTNKMFAQTSNTQNQSKMIDNSSDSFNDQANKLEEDKDNHNKYYLKCEKTRYSNANVNWTKKINLDKNKEQDKNYNNEGSGNNYSDIKSIHINNLENFTAYFDKIWEIVMQEISGY